MTSIKLNHSEKMKRDALWVIQKTGGGYLGADSIVQMDDESKLLFATEEAAYRYIERICVGLNVYGIDTYKDDKHLFVPYPFLVYGSDGAAVGGEGKKR